MSLLLTELGKRQKRIEAPFTTKDNQIKIASLKDLFGTKLNTVQHRAECKVYIDIDALIQSGINLENGLGYAKAIFGTSFDPATSLRALCSYRDGDLNELNTDIKKRLTTAATAIETIQNFNTIN